MFRKKRSRGKIEWNDAPDIAERIGNLQRKLDIDWINVNSITCFRSINANTRAIARIWGLGKVWQQALSIGPHYIVEVVAEKYDRMSGNEQDKVLLHEITHIPRNFSGALVPHIRHSKNNFNDKVRKLVSMLDSIK